MIPILFDKNANSFTSNGKGRLDFLSCKINEERNGLFELEGEISDKVYHSSEIEMDSIILAKVPDQSNLQRFRVYKITKAMNGKYMIHAQHISYQLSYIPVMPFSVTASAAACNQSLQGLKSHAAQGCSFDFVTDVTTVSSFGFQTPISLRKALGGIKGSILERFGGEYLWDNMTVYLKKNRGKTAAQKDVTLRYGKDITDLNQEENISNTVTGVVPFWINSEKTEIVTLTEKAVESQYASAYPFKRTIPLDCSQQFENKPTEAELRTYAQSYINSTQMGIPEISIKVSFINLNELTANELQRVKLCDNIGVVFEKLGINTTAKVVKYTYDVLLERYDSIEVGTIRKTLASTITDTNGAIEIAYDNAIFATNQAIGKAEGDLSDAMEDVDDAISALTNTTIPTAINNATAWLTGANGYVMAVKNNDGTWKELLFLDTADASQAHNVLRINENGIGFSRNGVNGPFTQAWTLDGKLVIGGTNVPELTVYTSDNVNTRQILFKVSRDGIVWNTANSTMTANGTLTANGADLSGKLATRALMGSDPILDPVPGDNPIYVDGKALYKSIIMNDGDIYFDIAIKENDQYQQKANIGKIMCNYSNDAPQININSGKLRLYGSSEIAIDTDALSLSGDTLNIKADTFSIHKNSELSSRQLRFGDDDFYVRPSTTNFVILQMDDTDITIKADSINLEGDIYIKEGNYYEEGETTTIGYLDQDGVQTTMHFKHGLLVDS